MNYTHQHYATVTKNDDYWIRDGVTEPSGIDRETYKNQKPDQLIAMLKANGWVEA